LQTDAIVPSKIADAAQARSLGGQNALGDSEVEKCVEVHCDVVGGKTQAKHGCEVLREGEHGTGATCIK